MVGNHIIHIPSTVDVTTLCLHTVVPYYHCITLFNPLTISLKLYTIRTQLSRSVGLVEIAYLQEAGGVSELILV